MYPYCEICDKCYLSSDKDPCICSDVVKEHFKYWQDKYREAESKLEQLTDPIRYVLIKYAEQFDSQEKITIDRDDLIAAWDAAHCQYYNSYDHIKLLSYTIMRDSILIKAKNLFTNRNKKSLLEKLTLLKQAIEDWRQVQYPNDMKNFPLEVTPEEICNVR